ncbi:hypothetical protein V2J09_009736 [Rumex salicifolius]
MKGMRGHINNQYNTCFWTLVKSGRSKSEAQKYLKEFPFQGTQAQEKNELLKECSKKEGGETSEKWKKEIIIDHNDIITDHFWISNPHILGEMPSSRRKKRDLLAFPLGIFVGCTLSFILAIWMNQINLRPEL